MVAANHKHVREQVSPSSSSRRERGLLDFNAINQAVLPSLRDVLPTWLRGGKQVGNEYKCSDLNGGSGQSMSVNTESGNWSDFAYPEHRGSDPISLYAAINGLPQYEAAMELSSIFGLNPSPVIALQPKQSNLMALVGVPMAQPLSARDCHHHSLGEPSQIWVYRDERGDVLQHVARYDTAGGEKEFRPWTNHDGEWIQKGPTGPRPLYGLDKLANKPESSVIVCEGEKATDAAQRLYPYAVTISWSGGSSSVAKSDWTPLSGREVTIWPDADDAGAKASKLIVQSLTSVAASVHVANVSDKPNKWDAADAEAQGWTPEEVDGLLASAEFVGGERPLFARTYDANFDPATIPVRPWIIHGILMRRYLTAVFAPAGVGKSVFSLALAIMAATESKLLSREQHEQASVLYVNNEDDQDEIDRRVAGICRQHGIPHENLNGRLYTASGYGDPLTIAKLDTDGTVVQHPDVERIVNFCRKHDIGVIVLDPFVSTHDIPENNNSEIEKVATTYRAIASATNAAILLVHHTRKIGSDTEAHAGDAEAGRGASSLIGAARIAFTLARMSKGASDKRGIDWELGNQLIRMDDGKMNFALRQDEADWYKMVSVDIGNGENVGVPVPFDMAEISRLADETKAKERASQNQIRVTEIAAVVATCMTDDKQQQPEVIGAYQGMTGKGKTAANDAFAMLPVGMNNSVSVMVDGARTSIWRERIGTETRPYYLIHRITEG